MPAKFLALNYKKLAKKDVIWWETLWLSYKLLIKLSSRTGNKIQFCDFSNIIIPRPRQLSLSNFAVVFSFLAALFGPTNYRERILKLWQ